MFEPIADKLNDAKKIVFVTGAGISQESGIPTFRGTDGLWRKYDPMQLATIDALLIEVNPEETIMSSEMDLSLKMTSAKALPDLIKIFENMN